MNGLPTQDTSDLLNLLLQCGRLESALILAEDNIGYTGRARVGPLTRLAAEASRLQVLCCLGRYDEVLTAVESHRPIMNKLPLTNDLPESVTVWNVREVLLGSGRTAALYTGRFGLALELNAEILKVMVARGAESLEVTRSRIQDSGPLIELGRYEQVRDLLTTCRSVCEDERDIEGLSYIYSALADLEDATGDRAAAARFEETALMYRYQIGMPDGCSASHNNMSYHLVRLGADLTIAMAHRMAAAVLCFQMRSGRLSVAVKNLAISGLPAAPLTFAEVAQRVESVQGVRFRELFDRLPRTAPDGDAAIAAVWQLVLDKARTAAAWQLVLEERAREAESEQRQKTVLAAAPEAVRAAFELDGEELRAALVAALGELNGDEATALKQRLREVGLIDSSALPDFTQILAQFEPLLNEIAAAANEEGQRAPLIEKLTGMEQNGWHLTMAVQRLWAGERNANALTDGLDAQDSALIHRILEILETP